MKKVTNILLLLMFIGNIYGQTISDSRAVKVVRRDSVSTEVTPMQSIDTIYRTDTRSDVTIFYRFDRAEIDSTYLTNNEALDFIEEKLTDSLSLAQLDSLSLIAISSPEGPLTYNQNLSMRRVKSFRAYLISKYPYIEPKIKIGHYGEEWDTFARW